MLNILNKIETWYLKKILSTNLFKTKIAQDIFQLLNNGNTYWHLAAKTQNKELLTILEGLKIDINQYNKEGIAPIHLYLFSIINFKKIKDTEGAPYFNLDKIFFERFLDNGVQLDLMWIKPILSEWRANKQKGEHNLNALHNFNFPSLSILGYPIEILFLIYRDFFTYHSMPEYVYHAAFEDYQYLFNKLYQFDDRDFKKKEELNKKYNITENIVYNTDKISIFMVNYIGNFTGFYLIIPLLSSKILDFTAIDNYSGNLFLHFLFGKIKSYQHKTEDRLQILMAEKIYENPNFEEKHLQALNNMGYSPINIFSKDFPIFIETFKILFKRSQVVDLLKEKEIHEDLATQEQYHEDESDWKI